MTDLHLVSGDGPHQETRLLLPWLLNGRLDADERERLMAHLAACPECQADADAEQAVRRWIAKDAEALAPAWPRLRARLAEDLARETRPRGRDGLPWATSAGRSWKWPALAAAGWALAACLLILAGGNLLPEGNRASPVPTHSIYHVLGGAATVASDALVVMFRPSTSESDLRRVLVAGDARIIDGPTAAGAYVIHAPAGAAARRRTLAMLRADPVVLLAEPLDGRADAGDASVR